ncbi:hypothetical protein SCUP234_02154 [Seiridium cupressi]
MIHTKLPSATVSGLRPPVIAGHFIMEGQLCTGISSSDPNSHWSCQNPGATLNSDNGSGNDNGGLAQERHRRALECRACRGHGYVWYVRSSFTLHAKRTVGWAQTDDTYHHRPAQTPSMPLG